MRYFKALTLNVCVALAIFMYMPNANMNAIAAVTSLGEINVEGDEQARVPAGSTVTLIITLSIDRSLAEPGEEIKTFEIVMPNGFETKPENLKAVTRNSKNIESATAEISGQFFQVVFGQQDIIADFSSSIIEIIFDAKASDIPGVKVEFFVLMKNLKGIAIGDYIKPGNADSKDNNNQFSLNIIPNKPPQSVVLITLKPNPEGENDIIVYWEVSNDTDVTGYWIYRDDSEPIKIAGREINQYRDINVSPGSHEYSISAYKTPLVKSERSNKISVNVTPDVAPPSPPLNFTINTVSDGVELKWLASPSFDVVRYIISFGKLEENIQEIGSIDAEPGRQEYEETDNKKLSVGRFTYAIKAVDEAGNISENIFKKINILGKPYPNPFTPLSSNEDFNKVFFPKRALEDVEGEFSVQIYSINGMLVKELIANPGELELTWDGKDEDGEICESGIYIYQIKVGDSYKTGTIILAK